MKIMNKEVKVYNPIVRLALYQLKRMHIKVEFGYYVLVEWSNEAIETGYGYNFLKKIVHYYNGYKVKEEPYSEPEVNSLKNDGIIVKDLTRGEDIPRDSITIPPSVIQITGNVEIEEK